MSGDVARSNEELSEEIAALRARVAELEQAQAQMHQLQANERAARVKRDDVLAEAEMLNQIAIAASGENDLNKILEIALARLADQIQFTGGSIAVVEDDELVIRAAQGPFRDVALGQRLKRNAGRSWRVIESGKPFLSNDLAAERITTNSKSGDLAMRSYLAVPLFRHGRTFGLMEIDSTQPNAFVENDIGLVQKVALALSGSIEVAYRYTAEMRTLEKVSAERERLFNLFMQAPVLIGVIRAEDKVYEFANPLVSEAIGGREVTNKALTEVLPELEAHAVIHLLDYVIETGRSYTGNEVLIKLRNQESGILEDRYFNFVYQPLLNDSGQTESVVSFAHEVTEQVQSRKQIEELVLLLGQRAGELTTILEAIPDGILVADVSNMLTRVNPRGAELLGLQPSREPKPFAQFQERYPLFYPDGRALPDEDFPLSRALRGQSGKTMHLVVRQPDGDKHVQFSYTPIRDEGGAIRGAITVARDITELYYLERQKDEFLSVASHELKTPITSIKGLTQMVIRRLNREGRTRDAASLQIVDEQLNRLIKLVNDLLDVSRIQTGKLSLVVERFNLAACLRRVCEAMQATTERHTLHVDAPERIMIEGDVQRIEQVMANLLSNAIKYSPEHGKIEIRLEAAEKTATISVRDYGIGIPPADRARLFERFHRGSNVLDYHISGFGIGLYISNEIVRSHGGSIWLDDMGSGDTEQGSRFCIQLPLPR